jgi:predicted alpha/beta hydrolase family esterase
MLVAPADLEAMEEPGYVPIKRLGFPSVVVASENDPWVTLERAQIMASAWDSDLVNIGEAGHINADSGLGEWSEGWQVFENLLKRIPGQT